MLDEDRYRYARSLDFETTLTPTEKFGATRKELKKLEANKENKILRIHTEPANTNKDQVKYMRSQAIIWNKKMMLFSLSKTTKNVFLNPNFHQNYNTSSLQ